MSWIGQPLRRREDERILRGAGIYLDDIEPPGVLHAAFVRSPFARARIGRVHVPAHARKDPLAHRVVHGEPAHVEQHRVRARAHGVTGCRRSATQQATTWPGVLASRGGASTRQRSMA